MPDKFKSGSIREHTNVGHNHNVVMQFNGESPGSDGCGHNCLSCDAIWWQNYWLEDTLSHVDSYPVTQEDQAQSWVLPTLPYASHRDPSYRAIRARIGGSSVHRKCQKWDFRGDFSPRHMRRTGLPTTVLYERV
ncbi:hypothetical protein M5K25_020949 [Dendrobium thyrsiflorum]|uniref:Uncharacterized protein n=1 Tax=Dendrobium thyrsiflorum TaxID=117978 RepID=A0ABD0UBE7_DENTH